MVSTADDLLPRTTAGENVEWPLGYASVQPDRLTAAGVGEINPNADFRIKVSRDTEAAHNPCDHDPHLGAWSTDTRQVYTGSLLPARTEAEHDPRDALTHELG